MAATGFTPISLYYSTTASAVPLAANLANGELALNTADMKLYSKNSAGVVTLLASNAGAGGTVSSVSGTGTVNGLTLTGTVTTSGSLTLGGTLSGTASLNINGTVGATTPTTGAFTSISATGLGSFTKAADGANGSINLGIANSANGEIRLFNGSTPTGQATVGFASGSGAGDFQIVSGGGSGLIRFTTGSGETMRLLANTNVLIGSTSASSGAKLEVTGSISSTTNIASGTLAIAGAAAPATASNERITVSNSYDATILSRLYAATAVTQKYLNAGWNGATYGSGGAGYMVNGVKGIYSLSAGGQYITSDDYTAFGALSANGYTNVSPTFTEYMRLNSTGLGIGTSSPAAQLQLNKSGTGDYTTFRLSNSGGSGKTYEIGVGGNTSASGYANNLYFYDSTAGALRMVLDTAGNVGIGTSSPSTKLHVASSGTGAANPVLTLDNAGGWATGIDFKINNGGYTTSRIVYDFFGTEFGSSHGMNYVSGRPNFSNHWFRNSSNAVQMVIDNSGNLGLGVTPSAWGTSGLTALQIRGAGFMASDTQSWVFANAYFDGATTRYINNGFSTYYRQNDGGAHKWYTAPSGTAGNAISFTQAMTLDASGYLMVGTTTSPSQQAVIYRTSATTSNGALLLDGNGNYAGLQFASSGTLYGSLSVDASALYLTHNSVLTFRTGASTNVGGTERARISSTGGFSVGTTADPGAGAIYATGAITAFYSDARLKTVSGKIENALDKVSKLSGVYYTNNDTAKSFGYTSDEVQVGVLAQEIEAVLPQVVKAAPFDLDENGNSKSGQNYKTVQYEKLVPLLIEAINELRAEVTALKGTI